jgi:hypothetical protein
VPIGSGVSAQQGFGCSGQRASLLYRLTVAEG